MRQNIILGVIVLALAVTAVLFSGSTSSAQTVLSDEQRDQIRANCTSIKNTLNQLKATDALLRVNRGQIYSSMGSRLMDTFNARLNGNSLDARGLVATTGTYTTALSTFRTNYQVYERQLATAIRIDCTEEPDTFYFAIENARSKREILNQDVQRLHQIIDDYRSGVNDFRINFDRVAESN